MPSIMGMRMSVSEEVERALLGNQPLEPVGAVARGGHDVPVDLEAALQKSADRFFVVHQRTRAIASRAAKQIGFRVVVGDNSDKG
jgi:hypothetical protein